MEDNINENTNNRNKRITILVIILLIVISIITGTYAWFTWSSTDNTNLTMTIGKIADVTFESGNDITTGLTPVFSYTDGESTTFSVINRSTSTDMYYSVKLNITSIDNELISDDVKYALVKNNEVVKEGNLSSASAGNSINIYISSLDTGTVNYVFYLYIDGNMENDVSMIGKTIVGTLTVEEANIEPLVTYISNLYTNADKTVVTNNNIEYNYATSVSLMNDRLGGTTTDYDAGNIRYYGASPNNYIDIGDVYEEDTVIDNYALNALLLADKMGITSSADCYTFLDCTNYAEMGFETEASCNTELELMFSMFHVSSVDEICGTTTKKAGEPVLYRVIGLFKDIEKEDGTSEDLVKVIREDYLGMYAWDLTATSLNDATFANDWSNSTLNTVFKTAYYNSSSISHSYYDVVNSMLQEDDIISTVETDFSSLGLSSSARNRIESVVWNLGGHNDAYVYSNEIYEYERGTTVYSGNRTEWTGNIALMYPSDYGYGIDFTSCSETLGDFSNNENCFVNDWLMRNYLTVEWLLTPNSDGSDGAWAVLAGNVSDSGVAVIFGFGARPVFYLNSKQFIVSGDGSRDNPLVLA